MALKWEIKLIKPLDVLRDHANQAWARTLPEIEKWMQDELLHMLVYGGQGIQGIAQTDFYKFITSDDGLSQLGIESSEPPKLLQAYLTSAFKVRRYVHQITLQFGNYAALKAATPHPANGTGNLHIDSWLEWVEDDLDVDRGYVPRNNIPGKLSRSIRLGSPLGGLMLPRGAYGSSGLWRFPSWLKDYEDKWFSNNVQKIQDVLIQKMIEVFSRQLVS
jgi:hypothetical protein